MDHRIPFTLIQAVVHNHGYSFEFLPAYDQTTNDAGLPSAKNDAHYPTVLMIEQLIVPLKSGKNDTNRIEALTLEAFFGVPSVTVVLCISHSSIQVNLRPVSVWV
jgi:predicted nucleotide-binding protein (sugar kinase/HSP70/actin superfamily)